MSSIDPTKPTTGTALTADVRANFQTAKDEIEALDANKAALADLASITDATKGSFLVGVYQNITGYIGRTLSAWISKRPYSPYDFGGTGDGVANDSAAVLAASVAAVATGVPVSFSGGTWLLGTQLALTSAHSELTWQMDGGTLKKGFNGDLATLNATVRFAITGRGTIDGQDGTYTGKGFVFSGGSHYPYFSSAIYFYNWDDAPIEFGADSGFRAKVASVFRHDTIEKCAIRITGPDTEARFRNFNNISANGYVEITGGWDTSVSTAFVTRVVIDSTSNITKVIGTVWGSGGTPVSIDGTVTIIMGCRIASAVTLNVGFGGVFVGNPQTTGGFTDNSIGGNVLIHHHIPAAAYQLLEKAKLTTNVVGEIRVNILSGIGDTDVTWNPDSSSSIFRFATSLTAHRTVTLTTSGARAGMEVRITRTAGDTGGPWNLIIGATGKNLAQNEWCDVIYNGSNWEQTAYGTLI